MLKYWLSAPSSWNIYVNMCITYLGIGRQNDFENCSSEIHLYLLSTLWNTSTNINDLVDKVGNDSGRMASLHLGPEQKHAV